MNAKRGKVGESNSDLIEGIDDISTSLSIARPLVDEFGIQSRMALYARSFSSRKDSIGNIHRKLPHIRASLRMRSRNVGSVIAVRKVRQAPERFNNDIRGRSRIICKKISLGSSVMGRLSLLAPISNGWKTGMDSPSFEGDGQLKRGTR